jgi:hypothetical protein
MHPDLPPGDNYRVRELPPYTPKNSTRAVPKSSIVYVDLEMFCFSRKWRDAPPELYYNSAEKTFWC